MSHCALRAPLVRYAMKTNARKDYNTVAKSMVWHGNQKNARNPNHHYFSKKYCNTPSNCIAIHLQFVLQYFQCPYALRKGEYCQYSSHLYRSTPPICIAVLLRKSWWLWSPGCSPEKLGVGGFKPCLGDSLWTLSWTSMGKSGEIALKHCFVLGRPYDNETDTTPTWPSQWVAGTSIDHNPGHKVNHVEPAPGTEDDHPRREPAL